LFSYETSGQLMKKGKEIRREFIEFFTSRGHTFVPSAPVVPVGDPTLLFVNAGMNQFKDVFLGTGRREYSRAVNSQKCIRVSGKHNDLEDVGKDSKHHTFFEMLGNWSFGDYGKREAITWAWELLTEVWKLPKNRLYATVYSQDEEAAQIWQNETDIGGDRIFSYGNIFNFWEMGEVGPCGPCSEIHFDTSQKPAGVKGARDEFNGINGESPLTPFVEIWNLVFIQNERLANGELIDLPNKHVDTGMGFERICAVLQNKLSNYDTDLFWPLIEALQDISGKEYERKKLGEGLHMAFRVVADHARMLTFALADGAVPSNEGRGYVVRRILRRASRYGRDLGMKEPFIHRLVGTVVDLMGEFYPEIVGRAQHVAQVIKAEEEGFGATLDRGLELFGEVAQKTLAAGRVTIGGEDAFRLYDTFGFPFDLTVLMAREKGLKVDEEGFRTGMENRQKKSRAEGKFAAVSAATRWAGKLPEGAESRFEGYETLTVEARVIGADECSIVLDRTPFYPEGGGQVADIGAISGKDFSFTVNNVQRTGSVIVHEGAFTEGGPDRAVKGTSATACVGAERRLSTARNHTATHLLHRALLAELGESSTQAGSLVGPDYLRFDFHHYEKLQDELILGLERRVNAEIRADRPVKWTEEDYEKAIRMGAMALFTDKYEKRVRVVEVEGFSRELCGGTHVRSTGRIGAFVVTGEAGVAAGIRRIEALTGEKAVEYLLGRSHALAEVERSYAIPAAELPARIDSLLAEQKSLSRELARARQESLRGQMDELLAGVQELPGGIKVLSRNVPEADLDSLKNVGDSFREKAGRGAALFATVADGKILFVCVVTDDLVKEGRLKAGDLVGRVARLAGGGGGGKPHLATAGGRDLGKLDQALAAFAGFVEEAAAG